MGIGRRDAGRGAADYTIEDLVTENLRLLETHRAFLSRVGAELRARRVSGGAVVAGFLASLRSRRLELRSALGSFAVLRHFPAHRWQRVQGGEPCCPVCGGFENTSGSEDLNVLQFERFKWGGVRHSHPVYAAFDLERFAAIAVPDPTSDDYATLRQIIRTATDAPEGTGLAGLAKALATEVPSNDAERRILIQILGYCGILRDPGKPSYFDGFPHHALRPDTPWRNDWPYPAQWWNAEHGVDVDAVSYWFPAS